MNDIDIVRAWRRLMLNEDGTMTGDAETIMRDLERVTGWMVTSLPLDNTGRVDPYRAAAGLATRTVYSHIKKRLYGDMAKMVEREKANG